MTHVFSIKPVISKLLWKKPPCIMSTVSASRLCNQDTSIAFKGLEESKKGEREKRQICKKLAEVRRLT